MTKNPQTILSRHVKSEEQKDALKTLFPEFDQDKNPEFKVTLENRPRPKMLYHYTSMDTLNVILEKVEEGFREGNNNNLIFRGTQIEFLNDREEFEIGLKVLLDELIAFEKSLPSEKNKGITAELTTTSLKENIMKYKGTFTSPFITSFSKGSDILPMWTTYAATGKGVVLGIKKDKIKIDNANDVGFCQMVDCTYGEEYFRNFIKGGDLMEKAYKMLYYDKQRIFLELQTDPSWLAPLFTALKHRAFEYENEFRLVKNYQMEEVKSEVNFQDNDNFSKPYVEHAFDKNILKEVIIGPTANKELAKEAVKMRLIKAGYVVGDAQKDEPNYVEVKNSDIPYRLI